MASGVRRYNQSLFRSLSYLNKAAKPFVLLDLELNEVRLIGRGNIFCLTGLTEKNSQAFVHQRISMALQVSLSELDCLLFSYDPLIHHRNWCHEIWPQEPQLHFSIYKKDTFIPSVTVVFKHFLCYGKLMTRIEGKLTHSFQFFPP